MLARLGQRGVRIPTAFHRQVEAQVDFLTGPSRGSFRRALGRARPLLNQVRDTLERNNLPPELAYLPLIESGYQAEVTSSAGARGLWQLMPGTARDLGLTVSDGADERTDPVRSTEAAARFINGLIFEYGADGLMLAVASYNKGPAGVRVALKKMDDPFRQRNFWSLVDKGLLPQETVDYVPRFVAAGIVAENPAAFGVE
jgi:membrane-bound lytic murein transglycosylase D